MRKKFLSYFMAALILVLSFLVPIPSSLHVIALSENTVVINEISWMGTTINYNNEWIELYNNSTASINLNGWTLKAKDGTPSITLSGTIPANGYFLLERTSDATVTEAAANQIYTGALGNEGEYLELRDSSNNLIDSVDTWYSGNNTTKATMERIDPLQSGLLSSNWNTATMTYSGGLGTPKAFNSIPVPPSNMEQLNTVSDALGAINIYFNKSAVTSYASSTSNKANYHVNLENRLIKRINAATTSIDVATYEINLPNLIAALMNKASKGVKVRLIADAKNPGDADYSDRYTEMRLYLEKMIRGYDGVVGTSDDIIILADSPIFAVEDTALRTSYGLPATVTGFTYKTLKVGTSNISGYLIAEGEKKTDGSYYAAADQMHNKFMIIDNSWVWTGSWNFTITCTYGSEENMRKGILGGNSQHSIEINWPTLASIYKTEFDEMWGSSTLTPNTAVSNFHGRKIDNTTHSININGKTVEIYFSPGDNAMERVVELVNNEAHHKAYFTIFAWSHQALTDALKYKWEGSYLDMEGTKTGFDVRGVFEGEYWNQWWSASVDMTGRTASQTSTNNPNIRWNNPAPVYKDAEDRKLHSKTMIIDVNTSSDPTVIAGSTNWSNNGENVNDENMLIIHDANIANQFLQEFVARYQAAGGTMQ